MKKTTLVLAGALFIGATATFAQSQDTTRRSTQPTQPTQQQPTQQRPSTQATDRDDMTGWTSVNSTDVPASLRETLNGTQYSGWDNQSNNLYRNEAGEYRLRMGDRDNEKTYYFDRNGKSMKKPNKKDNKDN